MRAHQALEDRERARIGLAAAVAGGCRTCAERLFAAATEAGLDSDAIEASLEEGLRVRTEATRTMRHKAVELLGRAVSGVELAPPPPEGRIEALQRLAAAIAANSSPDARRHLATASAAGASEAALRVAVGIGRAIRAGAQRYSDEELADLEAAEVPCPPDARTPVGASAAPACCGAQTASG